MRSGWKPLVSLLLLLLSACGAPPPADPLPSWTEGTSKRAVIGFVERVTSSGSADFVPVAERIAVFDNDGTLWCEQPLYVQAFFALDRVKALAPKHPEWKTLQPFQAVLEGDREALSHAGHKALLEVLMATHAGDTTEQFEQIARSWVAEWKHPRFGRLSTELVYQPMLELLAFLRANGFRTFIVSGGGIDFMRPWTERIYGIPPSQVVGSSIKTRFEQDGDRAVLRRLPEIEFVDDGDAKPVGIQRHIGQRPLMAFGNSDGDLQMLVFTTSGPGPRFAMLVRHDDAEREYAYDRDSNVGRLDVALEEAPAHGFIVTSMKRDWRRIFPGDPVLAAPD